MNVNSMDDDIGHILNGYACTIGNVDIDPTSIYGLEAVHDQLLLEGDHHIALEHDPEGPVLDHSVPQGPWPWVHRIIITRIRDHVVAPIATSNCIASKANSAISQSSAVPLPVWIAAPAVVDGIACATGKETKVPPCSAVSYAPAQKIRLGTRLSEPFLIFFLLQL